MTLHSENFGNPFQILRELGKGANGEVHLPFDNFLQRQVAIKIIRRKVSDDPEADRQNRNLWLNEGASLRQASAGLQARFSSTFLKLMISRLRDADERYIASIGLHV